jgi:antitoxin (DNA-binding transcriptional repressor) of toxin-antitoxin stability system
MKVSLQTAETTLSELIDAALAGEEVLIDREGQQVVKLVPVKRNNFQVGMLEGQLGQVPDFLEPMSEEELQLWEGGL